MTRRTTSDTNQGKGPAAARDGDRFTEWLRGGSEPNWTDATTHRFTRRLGTDDLDDRIFRRYLVQDYAFLDTLVGAIGHAVGHAPTMESKARLTEFLAVLTDEENEYFERAFRALDVAEATYADADLTPTTRAFEDLVKRAARTGGYGETLAVIVPAEWVYLTWATDVAQYEPSRFYLREWIDLHTGDAFEETVRWLRAELDREGETVSPRRRNRIGRLFRRTVELEVAFFDSAYDPRGTVPGGGDAW
ncbi:MAG: TenA family protein [Halanaeroarchaeum sp.]